MELKNCGCCGTVFDISSIKEDSEYYEKKQRLTETHQISMDACDGHIKEFKCPVCDNWIRCD